MKKLILLLTLLFVALTGVTQEKIKLNNGYALEYVDQSYTVDTTLDLPNIMFQYQINAEWKDLSLKADNYLYMDKAESFKFSPHLFVFDIEVSYLVTRKVKLYAKHRCVHPLSNSGRLYTPVYGGGDVIGISYNLK